MSFFVPDYIDPAIPLTRRQRQVIQKEAWTLWLKDWRNAVVLAALLLVMSGSMSFVLVLMGRLNVGSLLLFLTVYGVTAYVAIAFLYRFRFARLVRRVLRRHGYETCVKCGYWLRELNDGIDVCPECGTGREPHYRGVCPTCRTPIGDADVCLDCGRGLGAERTDPPT
jgi:uncharacterized paraquat-inducible protein A